MSAMQSKTRDLQSEERSIETADFNSRFKNNEDRTIENENPNLISFSQKDIFLNFKVDAPSIHDSFKEIDDFIIRSKSGKLECAQQKLQLATSQKVQTFEEFKAEVYNDMRHSLGYDREQETIKGIPPNRTDAVNLLQWLNRRIKKIKRPCYSTNNVEIKTKRKLPSLDALENAESTEQIQAKIK